MKADYKYRQLPFEAGFDDARARVPNRAKSLYKKPADRAGYNSGYSEGQQANARAKKP